MKKKLLFLLAMTAAVLVFILVRRSGTSDEAGSASSSEDVRAQAKDPRLLIRRFWFDRMPKRGEELDAWLFLGGGVGLEEKGSTFRFALDFFEFERRGSQADLVFLADKKKQTISFSIVPCSDKPPFDVCLDLKEPLRGVKRLWSFDDDADMDAHVPWAREARNAAEARARNVR